MRRGRNMTHMEPDEPEEPIVLVCANCGAEYDGEGLQQVWVNSGYCLVCGADISGFSNDELLWNEWFEGDL